MSVTSENGHDRQASLTDVVVGATSVLPLTCTHVRPPCIYVLSFECSHDSSDPHGKTVGSGPGAEDRASGAQRCYAVSALAAVAGPPGWRTARDAEPIELQGLLPSPRLL